jgi:isopenicillin N synthase-like dioxygenase
MIPEIDIAPLFGPHTRQRDRTDKEIYEAATRIGFMSIHGVPFEGPLKASRRESLLRLFDLSESERRPLWKQNFEPTNANLYRGWFPIESSETRCREGFEIGPDLVRSLPEVDPPDLLYEPSVFPSDDRLPGWRSDAADFYLALEAVGQVLLASLSRQLGIPEELFAEAFRDGISTLRLLRYPERELDLAGALLEKDRFVQVQSRLAEIVAGAHFDTGLVTVLAQYGVSGLQAQTADRRWVDVPVRDDGFAINFGGLLSRWTDGRIRATRHRVLSYGEERFSIPFFFEPRPDTLISPLPMPGASNFEPFLFGDHLWATTTRFPENFGLEHLRPPRERYRDPWAGGRET